MMDNEEMKLLYGFKFRSSDEIMLLCYLRPRVYGQELPCKIVEEKEIYGPNANPWHLFDATSKSWIDSGKFEKSVYVFTHLTNIAASSSSSSASNNYKKTEHYIRKAGCGTWHDETGREKMMFGEGENAVVGYKRLLVYQINDIGGLGDGITSDQVGYWKMHEYCLHGFEDYVLCQITWDKLKRAKVVRAKKAEVVSGSLTTSRSSSTKRNAQRNTPSTDHDGAKFGKIATTDDRAQVGRNDRISSSKKNGWVPDSGIIQNNSIVREEISVNGMNTDCTLQASTCCLSDVSADAISLGMENFLTDWSEEEVANLYNTFLLDDMDGTLDTPEEFSAALPSSTPDNNNDKQQPMQDYSSQVLGKRKSTDMEQPSSKRLCI